MSLSIRDKEGSQQAPKRATSPSNSTQKVENIGVQLVEFKEGHAFTHTLQDHNIQKEEHPVFTALNVTPQSVLNTQQKKDDAYLLMLEAIHSFDYSKNYPPYLLGKMEKNLQRFVHELTNERIEKANEQDKQEIFTTAYEIIAIGKHTNSISIQSLGKQLELAVLMHTKTYRYLFSEGSFTSCDPSILQKVSSQVKELVDYLAPLLPSERVNVDTLIRRLEELNVALISKGIDKENNPIPEAIQKIPPRRNSSFQNLRAKFEQSEEKRAPSVTSERRLIIPQEREKRLLEQIASLTLDKVPQLISSIQQHPHHTEGPLSSLLCGLKLLQDNQAFTHSLEELLLLQQPAQQLRAQNINPTLNESVKKAIQNTAKRKLLTFIKAQKNLESFQLIDEQISTITKEAIMERFYASQLNPGQAPQAAMNFLHLVLHLQKTRLEICCTIKEKWNKALTKLDSSHTLTAIVSQIGYLDFEKNSSQIAEEEIKKYINSFPIALFTQMPSSTTYQAELERLPPSYLPSLALRYNNIRPIILWINQHRQFIKKIYDQGSDTDRNMKYGTCERNCEDRIRLLLSNPDISSEEISMGSSSAGRYTQVIYNSLYRERSEEKEVSRHLNLSYKRIGLEKKTSTQVVVEGEETPQDALYTALTKQKKKTVFILEMRGQLPLGHAINIQFDQKKKNYRFIDDNLGIVACDDENSFRLALTSWLTISYQDLPEYTLTTFEA